MAAPVPLRERRHAETVAEIKAIALSHLAAGGPDALSLRAVARDLGVSVQALYHYFDSRDALVTALISDAFTSLGDAVAAGGATGPTTTDRLVGAGLAYRQWAKDNRAAFLLALGVPLPDYAAPEGGPTTEAAARMGAAFQSIVFGAWTPAELAAARLPGTPPAAGGDAADGPKGLPRGALGLFVTGWATLHGFVMLEVHGHLSWLEDAGERMCRDLLVSFAETLERARRTA